MSKCIEKIKHSCGHHSLQIFQQEDAVQKDRIDRIIARMNDMMTTYRNSQHERNKKDEHMTLPSPYGPFVKFELQHKADDDWRSFAVFYTGEATQGEIRGYGSSPELALEQIKQRYLDRGSWVYYGYSEYPI